MENTKELLQKIQNKVEWSDVSEVSPLLLILQLTNVLNQYEQRISELEKTVKLHEERIDSLYPEHD
jgi:hypothetical protein